MIRTNKLVFVTGKSFSASSMDRLQLTGQNLGWIFNFRSGYMIAMHLLCNTAILSNLELKTQPKQLLGYLPSVIELPDSSNVRE